MDMIIQTLAEELGQKQAYVENVVALLDEGNTIYFNLLVSKVRIHHCVFQDGSLTKL